MKKLALLAALTCVAVAAGTGSAAAAPARPHAPLFGLHISLPCANPANHDLVGQLLGAVRTVVGGPLSCFGQILSAGRGPEVMKGPTGLGPAQLQSAYKVSGLTSGGRTVAIVDAFNDPKAAADLATFRSTYGLPACTVANGCFTQENESGAATPLPKNDAGWAEEISLDLDTVSSICPDCHILLVEASSANTVDLDKAEDTAAGGAGVVAVSNSFGGSEAASELTDDAHFNHPGIAVVASSGDSGFGVQWPAASQYVTSVGGTTLTAASGSTRGWTETAWSGAGSGCSAFEPKPAWQHDSGCAKRTVADVSADADPSSGLGIYDTFNSCGSSGLCDVLIELGLVKGLDGWAQVGGTSLSSPLIASVYALAGNPVTAGSAPYANPGALFDVTSGSNGTCGGSYLCTVGPGYDGPTGLGTPNGTGAF